MIGRKKVSKSNRLVLHAYTVICSPDVLRDIKDYRENYVEEKGIFNAGMLKGKPSSNKISF